MSRQDTDNSGFVSETPVGGDAGISENTAPEVMPQDPGDDYRLVVENASQGVVIARENTIRYANPTITRYTGYTREELTSRPFIELIHPDDREIVIKVHRDVFLGKVPFGRLNHRIIDKDGDVKWMEVTGVPFTWEGAASTLLFIGDITERKETEDRLRQSEERYRDMVEHTGDLIYVTDSEGNFKFINQTIEREYGFSADELLGKRFKDIVTPESYAVAIETFRKQVKGIDVGIVEYSLYDKSGQIRTIEANERLVWEGDRAVEVYGIARDVTDRKRAEAALRESEEKYRLILDNAVEGILIAYENTLGYVNPTITAYTGYTREELLAIPFINFIYPDDRTEFLKARQELIDGKVATATLTHRFIDKAGNIRWAEDSAVPITWDGRPALLVFVKDVTNQKEILDELSESEKKHRLILENAVEGIAIAYEKELGYVNPQMTKYIGYTREELLERPFIDFIYPDDREEVINTHLTLMQGGNETLTATLRFIARNGAVLWASYTSVPVMWDGQRAVLSFVKDVTDEKRVLDELAESEEKYRLVVENAEELISVTVDGLFQLVNKKITVLSSFTENELLGKPSIELIHPDDRHLLIDHREKTKRGETPPPLIMRAVTKNGNIIWTENSIVPILWQGKPAALSIATDITERKRIEDALRESEEKYRLVVENASEIIVITRNGIVEFANSRVMTLFGVPPATLLGRHLSDLVIISDRERLHDELGKLISGEQVLPFYRYRMRDARGNIRSIEVNGIPIIWEGQPALLSFVSDITEKVDAEEEIKRRLRYEQAVAFCSRELVPLTDLELTMQKIVHHLLENLGVGGVFICKNVMDPVEGISMLTIAEAINDRHRPTLDFPIPDKVAYKYRSREMFDALSSGRWFGGPTKDYPPVDREVLAVLGSLSSIMIPIFVADTFWGFIGFDDYEIERVWDEQDILLLQTVSSIIGTAVARREAKDALTESEQKYRELVDSTSDMIHVSDFRGNIKFVNNAVRQLGYEPDEVIGRNFSEFYAPSSMKYAQELFRLQRSGVQLPGYELDLIRKDGQVRTIEIREDIKWEGERIVEIRGIGRDVTDRKKMDDRLRLVAGSQEAVLNSLSDMVFFADLALKITWANSATSKLTGLSIEEMVGRFCYEVSRQENAPCEGCPAVASLSSGRIEKNDSATCFGKNRRITAYPVPDLSGNITGMAVSIGGIKSKNLLDITESLSQIDDDIEDDGGSEIFLAPLDPNYIYPFSLSIDVQKDTFLITLRWDEYPREHVLKRLARSESAVARLIYLAARMKSDGSGWVDKDIIRAGTMDTNLNKLRSLLEESNVPFLDRFSSRMLIRSNREEKKKVRLALSASNIEISPNIRDFRSKKHRYMDAVSKRIRTLEREMKRPSQPKEYLISELSIQHQNEVNLKKSIEVVETLIGDAVILLKL